MPYSRHTRLALGIVAYTLDAGIYVLFQDWMSLAFHGLGLFYMFRGAQLLRGAIKAANAAPPPLAEPIAPPPVAG